MTDSAQPGRNPMETHVTVVAVLYLAMSAISVLGAVIMFVMIAGAGAMSGDMGAAGISFGVGAVMAFLMLLFAVPGLLAAWGLFKRKEWARVLTLVLSFISLLAIPIGTIIGAYGIWVMLNDDTKALFGRPAAVPAT